MTSHRMTGGWQEIGPGHAANALMKAAVHPKQVGIVSNTFDS